jgi:hypothetical protein
MCETREKREQGKKEKKKNTKTKMRSRPGKRKKNPHESHASIMRTAFFFFIPRLNFSLLFMLFGEREEWNVKNHQADIKDERELNCILSSISLSLSLPTHHPRLRFKTVKSRFACYCTLRNVKLLTRNFL